MIKAEENRKLVSIANNIVDVFVKEGLTFEEARSVLSLASQCLEKSKIGKPYAQLKQVEECFGVRL